MSKIYTHKEPIDARLDNIIWIYTGTLMDLPKKGESSVKLIDDARQKIKDLMIEITNNTWIKANDLAEYKGASRLQKELCKKVEEL